MYIWQNRPTNGCLNPHVTYKTKGANKRLFYFQRQSQIFVFLQKSITSITNQYY